MKLSRDSRYTVDTNDTTKLVRFHDFQNLERCCMVKDYSRTGVSFLLEDGSLLFKIGDVIADLRFYSLDQEVHTGSATIVHIQDEAGGEISRIGCSFDDRLMDIYAIQKMDKICQLQNDFLDFIQSMAIEQNLETEFVHLASHLHFILNGFKDKLGEAEERIKKEDPEIQPALLEALRKLSFDALNEELNSFYDQFSRIISRFNDSKQHFIHREFFQKHLNSFFMESALFNRAYAKPLGYAGDFEMMNIIYRNQFEGDSVFSQVMSKIDNEGPASKAVRNRRGYLQSKIAEVIRHTAEGSTAKVISVACGPCLEMYDMLSEIKGHKLPAKLEVIAMDQDRLALENARTRLEALLKEREDVCFSFQEDNIKRLIVGKDKDRDIYNEADLVYTAGLFDYLSFRAANRLIHKLYSFLKPGGLLVVGNFGTFNPQRFIMEYGSEWYLIHRSAEEIKEMAQGLPENAKITVEKEPEGVNLFLNVRKPK